MATKLQLEAEIVVLQARVVELEMQLSCGAKVLSNGWIARMATVDEIAASKRAYEVKRAAALAKAKELYGK